MQPCAVCGGQVVDQAGYCTQCGTFRGVPQYGYPAGPISSPPEYLGQSSGPPAYPQGPPSRQRNPFVVPLIALSVTLVVLVAAIVVVMIVRADRGTPGSSSLVDPCVVGNWRVISHKERVDLPIVGVLEFTGKGTGARVRLDDDGTGVTEFGEGTVFEAEAEGIIFTLTFTGSVNYDFRTMAGGKVTFSNLGPDGTATLKIDGVESTSAPLKGSADDASYTCETNTLKEFTSQYETELRREF